MFFRDIGRIVSGMQGQQAEKKENRELRAKVHEQEQLQVCVDTHTPNEPEQLDVCEVADECHGCIDNDSVRGHPCSLDYRLEKLQNLIDGREQPMDNTCVQVYCGNCDYGPITLDSLEDGEKTRCMSCGVYMHDAEIAGGSY